MNDPKKASVQKASILVVDDTPDNIDVLKGALRDLYSVRPAINGPIALKLAEMSPQPDMILLDVMMPEMDGYEVCRRLKANEKTRNIPVIFISAKSKIEDELKGLAVGGVDYITKPISPPIVQARVKTHLALKSAREKLEAAKNKAEEATLLKDKFVSLIAHDLRSPLSSILALMEYLVRDEENPLHDPHRELVAESMNNTRNLIQMIEEVLNIGRLKTGQITRKMAFFDPHFLVDELLQKLDRLRAMKELSIEVAIPPSTFLYGDRVLLGEVIQNLISNAIKFSHHQGTIRIESSQDETTSWLSVEDQGVGIPEKNIPNLFDVAEKVSTLGTDGEQGTGFGLPFSFGIMEAHGGQLTVLSKVDEGSRFTLSLPSQQPKILVVEDDPSLRALLIYALEPLNAEIIEAGDGEAAWQCIHTQKPHLVITDIYMPRMDGYTMLKNIRKNPLFDQLPILVISSDREAATRERIFRLGASDFTTKPIEEHDFLPRVRHLLSY